MLMPEERMMTVMMMGDYPPGVTGNEPELNDIPDMWIPDDCCRYCIYYDGDVCTREWNNGDEDYYVPERDDKLETDCCDHYEWNGELLELPKEPVKPKRSQYKDERIYKLAMNHYWSEHREWSRAYWKAIDARREDE